MAVAPNNRMRLRMMVILLMFVLFGGLLIARMFQLQMTEEGENLQQQAIDQQMSSLKINAARGEIKDSGGKTLAVSATVWDVVVDPQNAIKDKGQPEKIAEGLSGILGMEYDDVLEKCTRANTRHVYIKRRIDSVARDMVVSFLSDNKLNSSIYLIDNTKRMYPFGTLASTVLGFVNDEGIGGTGIESEYNKLLSGTPGLQVSAKTARNTDMPFRYNDQLHPAENGKTLILTIDETIQHYLEKHLETAVLEHNVKNRAVGIVMNPKTGEVLAMATKPDFDPNNFKEIYDGSPKDDQVVEDPTAEPVAAPSIYLRETAEQRLKKVEEENGGTDNDAYLEAFAAEQNLQWRNKAISDPYEPGSVFKVVTAASALDHGDVTLDNYFDCFGSIEVKDRKYGCWKPAGHGNQNFAEAIKHSCNPAFVRIGQMLGGAAFYDYFDAFGLTQGTGIDLPGEAGSLYHVREDIENNIVNLSSSSFGQTFKVTPIQMVTAVCAAVNGGKLLTPYVIKQVVDDSGNVVLAKEPNVRRQVISEETSQTMRKLMEAVVAEPDGSGRNAYIAGYRVGGKTGTSQKTDRITKAGETEEYVLSFAGIAPSDDPQLVVLVTLDSPIVPNIMGSTAAAPVVKYILDDILPYMGVEPKYTAEESSSRDVQTPNVVGLPVGEAKSALEEQKFTIRVLGEGEKVLKQVPSPSSPIPRDSTVIVYTDKDTSPEMVEVPDVSGMGTAIINERLAGSGFNIRLTGATGSGCVANRQSPEAGTLREAGSVVTVDLVAPNADGAGTIEVIR